MRHEFRLADIGEGLEEAEIITWLVQVGDVVERDQPLIEVMTDKSNAELPAPAAGTVLELSGAVGEMLVVGDLIAVIDAHAQSADTTVDAPDLSPPAPAPPPAMAKPTRAFTAATTEPAIDTAVARPKASPSTRRIASERGIDLSKLDGSGPGGRILLSDLDRVAAAAPAPVVAATPVSEAASEAVSPPAQVPPPPTVRAENDAPALQESATGSATVPLRGIRRAVAQNMTRSWSEIPHIHAFDEIDAEPLLELRQRLKATERSAYAAVTPLSFFVAAVAHALTEHPSANASIDMDAGTISNHSRVNVGVAVATEKGLVVPVLSGADLLDFPTLCDELTALVRAARDGTLARDAYMGGTVTISNFGALGGQQAVPLIRPPESLIVGFGSIKARPFVVDGAVVARKTMHLVAGADHRLLDGDVTTAVLGSVAEALTDPLRLVL